MHDQSEVLNEVIADFLKQIENGTHPDVQEFVKKHPNVRSDFLSFFAGYEQIQGVLPSNETATVASGSTSHDRCVGSPQVDAVSQQPEDELPRQFGDYELLEHVASGGMGIVYKARQRSLDRIVAIKMILAGQLATDSDVERFFREARSAGQLDHPSIVPVYEVGSVDKQRFFSMGYVDGGSLADRVADGPLEQRIAAQYTKLIAEAVAFAHQSGVIHRDIKPSNVLIDQQGVLKITDFGLATRHDGAGEITLTGQILGTPAYMPPEQVQQSADNIGPQSDIYSIGALLYCLLVGRPPFQAAFTLETLRQVLDDDPIAPRRLNYAIDLDLETICLKCLEKEPVRRYQTGSDLAADLARFLEGVPIEARPVSRLEKSVKWIRRHRLVASLAFAVVVLLLVGTGVSSWFAKEANHRAMAEFEAREDLQEKQQDVLRLASDKSFLVDQQAGTIGQLEDHLYVARVREAHEAIDAGDYDSARKLLEQCVPQPGDLDRRCFVWRLFHEQLNHVDPLVQIVPGFAFAGETGRLVLAPDGVHFAVVGGTTAVIGDRSAGEFERELRAGTAENWFTDVAFTKNGRFVAFAIGRGQGDLSKRYGRLNHNGVTLYDLIDPTSPPTRVPAFVFGDEDVSSAKVGICVACSPTQPHIACGLGNGRIGVWNYEARETVAVLTPPTFPPKDKVKDFVKLAYTPDGKKLVSARFAHSVDLWDVETHSHEAELYRYPARIQYRHRFFREAYFLVDACDLAISDDGSTVAVAANGLGIRLIDLATGGSRELSGHRDAVTSLSFVSDGRRLVSGSLDQQILLWDVPFAREIAQLGSHRSPVHGVAALPSGDEVISVGSDRSLRKWRVPDDGSPPAVIDTENHVYALVFRPDSDQLVSGGWPTIGGTTNWNVQTGTRRPMAEVDDNRVLSLDVTRDGRTVVSANQEGHAIDFWNRDGSRFKRIDMAFAPENVSIHPSGRLVAASPFFESVKSTIIDVNRGEIRQEIAGIPRFSPDGLLIASTFEGELQLYDANSLERIETHGPANVTRPRFSTDGQLLALKDSPNSFLIWDVIRNATRFRCDGHYGEVMDYGFAPDGVTIASVGKDRRVLLWDLRTGKLKTDLRGHHGTIRTVAFNRDGTLMATGSTDHTIRLWRASDVQSDFQPLRQTPPTYRLGSGGRLNRDPAADKTFEIELRKHSDAVSRDPMNSDTWATRAEFFRRHRRWEDALSDYAKAIKLCEPMQSKASLLSRSAVVACRARRWETYEKNCGHLMRLLEKGINDAFVFQTLCLSPKSNVDFTSLLKSNPSRNVNRYSAQSAMGLALNYLQLGLNEDAFQTLDPFVENVPDGSGTASSLKLHSMICRRLNKSLLADQLERSANPLYLAGRGAQVPKDDENLIFEILLNEEQDRHDARLAEARRPTETMAVYHAAMSLDDDARLERLRNWVLPDNQGRVGNQVVRSYATVTDSQPSIPENELRLPNKLQLNALDPDGNGKRILVGGNFVCPAAELVVTARKLGRLDELIRIADHLQRNSNEDDVQSLAFRILVRNTAGPTSVANDLLNRLSKQSARFSELSVASRLTILATLDQITDNEDLRPKVIVIAETLLAEPLQEREYRWKAFIARIRDRAYVTDIEKDVVSTYGEDPGLTYWRQHIDATFESLGKPHPTAHWRVSEIGELTHFCGHEFDIMFFDVPLRGDFAIEFERCSEFTGIGKSVYGGRTLEIFNRGALIDVANVARSGKQRRHHKTPLTLDSWYKFRLEVKDGVVRQYAGGQLVDEETYETPCDPWFALRSWRGRKGAFRNLRIIGSPEIPSSLDLSHDKNLRGWTTKRYQASMSGPDAHWHQVGDEIVGAKRERSTTATVENTLQYHRPLMEDGVIEYEFLYQPGISLTHFALDRLAFLLRFDGVAVHRMTDGNTNRIARSVFQESHEPKNQRGPSTLPLLEGWNAMKAEVTGDTLRLSLNETLVYEHNIERTNLRTFGFFHYRHLNESRVRNVTYRGDWPKQLTKEARNELAIDPVKALSDSLELAWIKEIDLSDADSFTKLGATGFDASAMQFTPDGLAMKTKRVVGKLQFWKVEIPIQTSGDFEVTYSLKGLNLPHHPTTSPTAAAGVKLTGEMQERHQIVCKNIARGFSTQLQSLHSRLGGKQKLKWRESSLLANPSGRLRITRKNTTIHFLQCAEGSHLFQHISSINLIDPKVGVKAITLAVGSSDAFDAGSVVWKHVTIKHND